MNLNAVLTERQNEILELISQGMQQKEVACELGISIKTVDNTIQVIKKKIGVNNDRELCCFYFSRRFSIPMQEILRRTATISLMLICITQAVLSFDTQAARRARRGRSRRNDYYTEVQMYE